MRTLQQLDFTGSNVSVGLCKKSSNSLLNDSARAGTSPAFPGDSKRVAVDRRRFQDRSCAASTWQLVHGSPCENAWAQSTDARGTNKRQNRKANRTSNKNTEILTIDRNYTLFFHRKHWSLPDGNVCGEWRGQEASLNQSYDVLCAASTPLAILIVRLYERAQTSPGVPCTLKRYMQVYSSWPQLDKTWTLMIWKASPFSSWRDKTETGKGSDIACLRTSGNKLVFCLEGEKTLNLDQ